MTYPPKPADLTVGILFPGEVGSTLGGMLAARGVRVVTTLEGRSERTAHLCHAAALDVLDSLGDVVEQADIMVSVVTPFAATTLARQVALEHRAGRDRLLYLDANSVSPVTMTQIRQILDRPDIELVDGAIHGVASRLATDGTLFLSGPAASELASVLGSPPRTVVVSDEIGRASLLKMLIGGVNKGLVALMFELSEVARKEGMLDAFWAVCRAAYPGVMEPFERLLPTYPVHAGRRGEEMAELEVTVSAAGRQPVMAPAIRKVFEQASLAPRGWDPLVDRLTSTTND